jgi:hypothetical protein
MGTSRVWVGRGQNQRIQLASRSPGLCLYLEWLVVVIIGRVTLEFYMLILINGLGVGDFVEGLYFEALICDLIARLTSKRRHLFILWMPIPI